MLFGIVVLKKMNRVDTFKALLRTISTLKTEKSNGQKKKNFKTVKVCVRLCELENKL